MKLRVMALGGTIASTGEGGKSTVPRLSADDLVQAVPELSGVGEVTAETVLTKPSGDLTLPDVVELAHHITTGYREGQFDAIVVTQGTDTIEETAFALSLLLAPELPVVVTGAMRNPSLPGADGSTNLLAAARVAASRDAAGLGVTVVLNDEIHAARYVGKHHTSSPAAFSSSPRGPIGAVTEGRVQLNMYPVVSPTFTLAPGVRVPDIPVVVVVLGDSGRFVQSLLDEPADGCVIASFGGGHVPGPLAEKVGSLAERVPTVLTSRTGGGTVLRETYGFPGSERDLLARGLIHGGSLAPVKARILLTVLLAAGKDKQTIRTVFASF